MQQDQITPDRAELMRTIQRCAEAYHLVMADMPQHTSTCRENEHRYKASLAYCAHLPILCDLASILIYIACVSNGVSIGALEPGEAGRFCHIAQTAMSAWKLANLTVPAALKKEEREAQRTPTPLHKGNQRKDLDSQFRQEEPSQCPNMAPKQPTPPPNGNHPEEEVSRHPDLESLYASGKLPDWETQKALFKSLRKRGVEVSPDEELRNEPYAALHFVETERWFRRSRLAAAASSASSAPPEPAQAPLQNPTQAA